MACAAWETELTRTKRLKKEEIYAPEKRPQSKADDM